MDLITIFFLIFFVLPLSLILFKEIQRRKYADKIDIFPGQKYYPIIGSTKAFIKAGRKNFWQAYHERNTSFGRTFRSWLGYKPCLHITRPEHMEIILKNSENIDKGSNYRFMVPFLGNGLVLATGQHWHSHRKMISPTFHFTMLDKFTEVFSRRAQDLADFVKNTGKANGQFFDFYPHLTHVALDIICETAMGVKMNALENSNNEYATALYGLIELVIDRMFNPLLHNDFIYNLTSKGKQCKKYLEILHGYARKVIRERKAQLENSVKVELSEEDKLMGKKERLAFLDLLLEANRNNQALTDEEIREEVDTFMFTGHDTTTVTVCWVLFVLGNYPKIQEKVHEELDSIFHGEEREITPEDINNMKYLERVVKETLRVYTIVPGIARNLTKEIEIDGHPIPSNVMVIMHLYELHKDPEQFPNPDVFDPDRFLPENSQKRHPYSFIPFSAGPRNCVGQKFGMRNSRCLVAALLRKYKVKSETSPEEVQCFNEIVLRPQNGLRIAFEERKRS